MSRHRDVRNLDIDDVLDEDQYDDGFDYDNQLNENELSNEDLDKLDDGLAYVYSVIGDDTSITGREIRDALWYYYFDYEETIGWALERMAKDKAIEDKKKEKEMAKKGK